MIHQLVTPVTVVTRVTSWYHHFENGGYAVTADLMYNPTSQ